MLRSRYFTLEDLKLKPHQLDNAQINDNSSEGSQIHQAVIDKVNKENPELQEKCQAIKDRIYELIRNV